MSTESTERNVLEQTPYMDVEHKAWQEFLDRLAAKLDGERFLSMDRSQFNLPEWDDVIDQVKFWAESLVALRLGQDGPTITRAYDEALNDAQNGRSRVLHV